MILKFYNFFVKKKLIVSVDFWKQMSPYILLYYGFIFIILIIQLN